MCSVHTCTCVHACVCAHTYMCLWRPELDIIVFPPLLSLLFVKTFSRWTWSSLVNHSELWVLPVSASGPSSFRNSVPIVSQCHLYSPNLNPCQSDRFSYSAHFIVVESCNARPLRWLLSLSMLWRLSLVLFGIVQRSTPHCGSVTFHCVAVPQSLYWVVDCLLRLVSLRVH